MNKTAERDSVRWRNLSLRLDKMQDGSIVVWASDGTCYVRLGYWNPNEAVTLLAHGIAEAFDNATTDQSVSPTNPQSGR